jgi:guanylate kinase
MVINTRKGNVLVLTGPSGVGKGSIVSMVLKKHNDVVLSVSATTRAPRPGEVDGVNYHFISKAQFNELIDKCEMLEWAEFAGNYYGTFKSAVKKEVQQGNDVILEIEVKGAMQVKEKLPEAKLLFIAPPSFEELKKRLIGRATEPPMVVEKRLAIAREELEQKGKFQFVVVNDDLETAIKEVEDIILSLRK